MGRKRKHKHQTPQKPPQPNMQLKDLKPTLKQTTDVTGILAGEITYDIKSATSEVRWTGPKIPADVWSSVLAWFARVQREHKSECQVRLYCNPTLNTWRAWAFPQEIRSGMTTREIDNDDFKAQRAQFDDSWHYLGTVHHHCSAGAFQSGPDRANEESQDGLHITIGNLESPRYSLHARFYFGGLEFIPDMSAFWDIGVAAEMVPPATHDAVARFQMTRPAAEGTAYPAQWDSNLISLPVVASAGFFAHGGSGFSAKDYVSSNGRNNWDGVVFWQRKEHALAMARREVRNSKDLKFEEFEKYCETIVTSPYWKHLLDAAIAHKVDIDDIIAEWEDQKARDIAEAYRGGY